MGTAARFLVSGIDLRSPATCASTAPSVGAISQLPRLSTAANVALRGPLNQTRVNKVPGRELSHLIAARLPKLKLRLSIRLKRSRTARRTQHQITIKIVIIGDAG